MSNRPNPHTFAQASYVLAFVSAIIITVALIPVQFLSPVRQFVIWLPLLTSAVGAFLGYAARSDFKRHPADDPTMRKVRIGWRVNLIIFVTMTLFGLVVVVLYIVGALPGR